MKKIIILLVLLIISCNGENRQIFKEIGYTQGTYYSISYIDENKIFNVKDDINRIFREIDNIFSTYRYDSEVMFLNRENNIVVNKLFKKIFIISKEINKKTNGYFDPTVGLIFKKINFEKQDTINILEMEKLKPFIGFEKMALDENDILIKENKSMYIDFNSLIKGYTVDLVAEYLDEKNIENYLVEIGGEIRVKGKKIDKRNWKVGIESPKTKNKREIFTVIKLKNNSLATSGNYRKYSYNTEGEKYGHIINPKDFSNSERKILSASILHKKCIYADGFATAIMACPNIEEAKKIISNLNLEAYIIYLDKENKEKVYMTSYFKGNII